MRTTKAAILSLFVLTAMFGVARMEELKVNHDQIAIPPKPQADHPIVNQEEA